MNGLYERKQTKANQAFVFNTPLSTLHGTINVIYLSNFLYQISVSLPAKLFDPNV